MGLNDWNYYKDIDEILATTQSNAVDGYWEVIVNKPENSLVLVAFVFEGDYNGNIDIAGAEFLTTTAM